MRQEYEYKFIRLGEGWQLVKKEARESYRSVIEQHAVDGWRLVQIFAPGIGAGQGAAKYFEIILERRVSDH